MKILPIILFLSMSFVHNGNSQFRNQKTVYNEKFNWTINVPPFFNNLDSLEVHNLLNEDEDVPIYNIFTFQIDQAALFQANYTEVPFELLYDEEEEIGLAGEEFFHTFLNEFPDSLELEIDTSYSTEWIHFLEFKKFEMQFIIPKMGEINARIYLRQFGDQELVISYFYNNPRIGSMMHLSLRTSKFDYPYSKADSLNPIPKIVRFQVEITDKELLENYDYEYTPYINLAQPEEDIKNLINPHEIVLSDTSAILLIDYPGVEDWHFEISSASKEGFSKVELIEIICQKYHQIFSEPSLTLTSFDLSEISFERRFDGKIVLTLGIDS